MGSSPTQSNLLRRQGLGLASNYRVVPFMIAIAFAVTCSATATRKNIGHHQSAANYTDFIKTSCGVTMYQKLCFDTLSPYADSFQTTDPVQLATLALNASLQSAQSTSKKVSELSKAHNNLSRSPAEARAMVDCVENMGDSVDELRKSVVAMKELEGPEFDEKMGNVMTWVSAALTDEDTCMEGFDGNTAAAAKDAKVIRTYIVHVAQLTSNALALINHIHSAKRS